MFIQDISKSVFAFAIAAVFYFALFQIFNEMYDIKSSSRFTTLLLIGIASILLDEYLSMSKHASNVLNLFGSLCIIDATINYFSDGTDSTRILITIGSMNIMLLALVLKAVIKKSK